MWLFNRSTTPKSSKPVQRQISIRTRDEQGDAGEGFSYNANSERSPRQRSSSSFVSPIHQNPDVDDVVVIEEDETSESTSTSDGRSSGRHQEVRASHNSSYTREPLDPRLLSSVTSPGFTTRAVQQANGYGYSEGISPLKEIMSNRSPFSRSPNGNLKIGQLPMSAVARRSPSSLTNFPTPRGRSLFTYGRYSRVGRRDGKTGTVFVKLAPVDIKGTGPPVTPNTPSPGNMSMSASGVLSLPSFNESNSPGLGGMPSSGLTQRFSRLWPNMPNSNIPGSPGYQASGSNNITDVLANRKRGRETEVVSEANKHIRQQQSVTASNSGADEVNKYSKRVKFVNDQEMRLNRPLAFDSYPSPNGGQPMTSILEQMNQTEKRFLPDSSLTSAAKKTKIMGSPPRGSSTPLGVRKRRGNSGISMVEEDEDEGSEDPRSKTGKFCHCNECYREAAGITSSMHVSPAQNHYQVPVSSPMGTVRKTVTFDETSLERAKPQSDKETETEAKTEVQVIIRKANHSSGYITKDKYDDDRLRRLERFRRILGLQKPEEPSKDQVDGHSQAANFVAGNTPTVTLPVSIATPVPIQFSSTLTNSSGGFNKPIEENVVPKNFREPEVEQQKEPGKDKIQEPTSTINFSSGMVSIATPVPIQFSNTPTSSSGGSSKPIEENGVLKNFGEPELSSKFKVETKQEPEKDKSQEPTSNINFTSGMVSVATTVPIQFSSTPTSSSGVFSKPIEENSVLKSFGEPELPSKFKVETKEEPEKDKTFSASGTTATSAANSIGFGNTQPANSGGFTFGQSQPQQQASTNSQPAVVSFGQTSQPLSSGMFNISTQNQPSSGFGANSATSGMNNLATPTTTAAFGASSTAAFGISSTAAFGASSTAALGANSSASGMNNLGTTTAAFGASSTGGMNMSTTTSAFGASSTAGGLNNLGTPTTTATRTVFGSINANSPSITSSTASPANSFSFGGTQSANSGGFAFGQSQPQASTTSQPAAVNFGQASQPQSSGMFNLTNQPPSIFGANSATGGMNNIATPTTTASTGFGSINGNSQSITSTAASPANSFSFGGTQSANSGGFSFGQSQPQASTSSQPAVVNFGQASQPQSSGMFNFSTPNQPSSAFGASSNLGTPTTNATRTGFGSINANSPSITSTATSPANSFSFGSAQPANSGGFAFGQPQTQTAANPQPGTVFGQTSQTQSSGMFNLSTQNQPSSIFGANSAVGGMNNLATPTTSALSGFGSINASSQSITSTPAGPANSFSFGNAQSGNTGGSAFGQSQPQVATNSQPGVGNFGQASQPQSSGMFNFSTQNQPSSAFGANSSVGGMNNIGTPTTTAAHTGFGSMNANSQSITSIAASPANSFSFGNAQPANSGGFAFGQPQTQTAANPQPGVFNFGQTSQPQSSPGGFNFSAQVQPPPAYGANPAPGMFNLGTSTAAAPRSRNTRLRKYR